MIVTRSVEHMGQGKNWRIRQGANYVAIEHDYDGRPTKLNPGDVYRMAFTPESAEMLAAEILAAVRGYAVSRDDNHG